MKKRSVKILALALGGLVLFGCVQGAPSTVDQQNNSGGAAGIVLAGADEEKNINLEDVKSIELYDLEGNKIDRTFTEEDIKDVVDAWNASFIDDTSYIEMITGYRMVITLEGDNQINITSYGNKERIVATYKDTTYHLVCPEIAGILLAE